MSIKPFVLRKPRSFSQTINDTFTYIERHLKPLSLAILYIPIPILLAGQILMVASSFGAETSAILMAMDPASVFEQSAQGIQPNITLVFGGWILLMVGFLMLSGTILGYVRLSDLYPGTEIPPARVWKQVKRFFWTDLGAFFIIIMIFSLGAVVVMIPCLGALAYVVFGLYLAVATSMIGMIYRMENTGIISAISRSLVLVKGYWWRIFGITLIIFLLQSFLTGLFTMSSQLLIYFVAVNSLDGEMANTMMRVIASVLQIVAQGANAFLYPVTLVCFALNYFSLTEVKEDVGLIRNLDQQLDALAQPEA